jgi:cytochrome b6
MVGKMVLMMILHVFRVYLTGGFKKPRDWLTGVVLAVLTASFGLTGYSLPRDVIGQSKLVEVCQNR